MSSVKLERQILEEAILEFGRDEAGGQVGEMPLLTIERLVEASQAEGRAAAYAEIVAMLRSGMCDLDEELVAGASHALRVIEARAKEQSHD